MPLPSVTDRVRREMSGQESSYSFKMLIGDIESILKFANENWSRRQRNFRSDFNFLKNSWPARGIFGASITLHPVPAASPPPPVIPTPLLLTARLPEHTCTRPAAPQWEVFLSLDMVSVRRLRHLRIQICQIWHHRYLKDLLHPTSLFPPFLPQPQTFLFRHFPFLNNHPASN